ncbi:hypothetical protein MCP1_70062 [Candidatus Terasakiella magnetica]|nr:hypothetical protein MCP1_70062 [Candidatus Terasakiella magnetica]
MTAKGIQPVSGPSVDGGRQYVYRRADLDGIDLAAIVPHKKRGDR